MAKRLVLAVALLFGCSSADFDVAEGADTAVSEAEGETALVDSESPSPDTGTIVVDDTSVAEVGAPDTCVPNACGGCGPLEKPPGTACGLCMTSKFSCSGTSTKCDQLDDRTEDDVAYSKNVDGNGIGVNGADAAAAVSFKLRRTGTITGFTLGLQRYDVKPTGTIGNLQIRLLKGTPTTAVAPADVVSTSLISATLIPLTPNTVYVLVSGAPLMAKDTPLWIEVTDQSELATFAVNGATAGSATDLDFHYLSSTGSYTRLGTIDPYLVVGMKACF